MLWPGRLYDSDRGKLRSESDLSKSFRGNSFFNRTTMFTKHLFALGATLALSLSSIVALRAQPERLFYYIDDERSYESLLEHIDRIDILAPGAFSVDADGIVWGDIDPRVLALAAQNDVPVMPLIVNPGFDQEMLSSLLSSPTARERAIRTMLEECRRLNLAGIQFDFENLSINDRDAFSSFFKETAAALHGEGRKISIAVVHRPQESPGPTKYFKWLHSNWRAGYDLEAIAPSADFVSVMTYSQHTRRTPPGPYASIPWMVKNIEYFLQYVPPEKLSLGIGVTSQHWSVDQDDRYVANARSWSTTLSHSQASALSERHRAEWLWLEDQGVAYTFFDRGGLFEWVFLEDARSFEQKFDLVRKYGLRGFSVWVIGYEDPGIWDIIDR